VSFKPCNRNLNEPYVCASVTVHAKTIIFKKCATRYPTMECDCLLRHNVNSSFDFCQLVHGKRGVTNTRPDAPQHYGIDPDLDLDPGWIFPLFQHGDIGRFYTLNRIAHVLKIVWIRDAREWLLAFPFPPNSRSAVPIPSHSHSHSQCQAAICTMNTGYTSVDHQTSDNNVLRLLDIYLISHQMHRAAHKYT